MRADARSTSPLRLGNLPAAVSAAKKIILLLWFIVASLATASALTPGTTETRVGQKSFAPLESRQAEPLQTAGLPQRNRSCGYELAPESLLAAYQQEWARMVVQERAAAIQAQLGVSASFGETYGVGVVQNSGTLNVIISSKSPYGLGAVNRSLLPGEQYINRGLQSKVHAEIQINNFAEQTAGNTLSVGATRPVCVGCQAELDASGVPIATKRK